MTDRNTDPAELDWASSAFEGFSFGRTAEGQAYEVYRAPIDPLPDGAQQVWVMPAGATEWEPLGYIDPVLNTVFEDASEDEAALVDWPVRYGKTAFTASIDAPLTDGLRALYDALAAGHQKGLDRRLGRLADDLGLWEPVVRRQFGEVQQVLEQAGIGDGYGRLTIPQPVRPPIEPPVRKGEL
ncbi:hypothetical protein [Streptomyces parvulus]|uniref:hypothetical protein n=1 Tax=Streptomyces parvulus TaxID=146923 RepID=UPI0033A43A0A